MDVNRAIKAHKRGSLKLERKSLQVERSLSAAAFEPVFPFFD